MAILDAGEQPNLVGAARLRYHLVVGLVAVAVICWTRLLHRLGGALGYVGTAGTPSSRCLSWVAIAASACESRGSSVSQERHTHVLPPCASANHMRHRIVYKIEMHGCRIYVLISHLSWISATAHSDCTRSVSITRTSQPGETIISSLTCSWPSFSVSSATVERLHNLGG